MSNRKGLSSSGNLDWEILLPKPNEAGDDQWENNWNKNENPSSGALDWQTLVPKPGTSSSHRLSQTALPWQMENAPSDSMSSSRVGIWVTPENRGETINLHLKSDRDRLQRLKDELEGDMRRWKNALNPSPLSLRHGKALKLAPNPSNDNIERWKIRRLDEANAVKVVPLKGSSSTTATKQKPDGEEESEDNESESDEEEEPEKKKIKVPASGKKDDEKEGSESEDDEPSKVQPGKKGLEHSAFVKGHSWEGHVVDLGNAELLTAIASDQPDTFHNLDYQSEFMWTVGLNTLCQLVMEFVVASVNDLTIDDVKSFRSQITDVETNLHFKLNWMHTRLNEVESLSKSKEDLQMKIRVLEAELESLETALKAKISAAKRSYSAHERKLTKDFVGNGILPSYQMG